MITTSSVSWFILTDKKETQHFPFHKNSISYYSRLSSKNFQVKCSPSFPPSEFVVSGKYFKFKFTNSFISSNWHSTSRRQQPTSATRVFYLPGSRHVNLHSLAQYIICYFSPPLSFNPGPIAICLLHLLKYCKYCRVALDVVAVEEIILWNNNSDRKVLAGVRKGLDNLQSGGNTSSH